MIVFENESLKRCNFQTMSHFFDKHPTSCQQDRKSYWRSHRQISAVDRTVCRWHSHSDVAHQVLSSKSTTDVMLNADTLPILQTYERLWFRVNIVITWFTLRLLSTPAVLSIMAPDSLTVDFQWWVKSFCVFAISSHEISTVSSVCFLLSQKLMLLFMRDCYAITHSLQFQLACEWPCT